MLFSLFMYILFFLFGFLLYSMMYSLLLCFFFFNDPATPEIYTYGHTLSLPDALPICLPTISMRAAAASTKLSSGITDRIARAARAVVTPSTRSSLPNRVWRAIESAGKLVSHSTSVSPCPMARSAYSMSAFSSGSMFLSNAPSRIFDVSCSAAKPRRLLAVGNPDVLHLHGMPQQNRPLGGGREIGRAPV